MVGPYDMLGNMSDPSSQPHHPDPFDPATMPDKAAASTMRKRRWRLPIMLFLLTCFSTFWVGANIWFPIHFLEMSSVSGNWMPVRETLVSHWQDGMVYMVAVLAILLTHEMGHFLATVYYRIPASLPIFLPFPISPIGTFGAVIGMDGTRANRREMFDIGLAGPLAGLVVALPIVWIGLATLDFQAPIHGPFAIDLPLAMEMILDVLQPEGYERGIAIASSQLNPLFMAGWVGLLITGLNMMPVSQLDGGHVVYTLFGRKAHWIARGFMVFAIAYIIFADNWNLGVMVVLVLLMGTDHPPTRDDHARLGAVRICLGYSSLLIPILCFAPRIIILRS